MIMVVEAGKLILYKDPVSKEDLELIKQLGLPSKIIAQRLGVPGAVIRMRVTRLAGKLGVENRTAIVIKAIGLGLVAPDQLLYREFYGKANLSGKAN